MARALRHPGEWDRLPRLQLGGPFPPGAAARMLKEPSSSLSSAEETGPLFHSFVHSFVLRMAHGLIQPSPNTKPTCCCPPCNAPPPPMEQGALRGLPTERRIPRVCQTPSQKTSSTYCAQDAVSGTAGRLRVGSGTRKQSQRREDTENDPGRGSQRSVGTGARGSPRCQRAGEDNERPSQRGPDPALPAWPRAHASAAVT